MSKIQKCSWCNGVGKFECGPEDPEECGGSWWAVATLTCSMCGGSGDQPGQFEVGAMLRDKRERGTSE